MNQKIVLIVLSLGTLMAAVDTTIVLLALPTITDCLHTNLFSSIWVLLAYLIVLAVLSTQAGRIGDLIGRGKIYNSGFILFTLASALAGISPNVCLLISFRVIRSIERINSNYSLGNNILLRLSRSELSLFDC